MNFLLERYRALSPGKQKASLAAAVVGVIFDALVIRSILRADATRFLPKVGWIGVTLLSTPGGGIAYLRYGRR